MLAKIAKGFRFSKTGIAKDLTYHGPVILDDQYLYLIHNKHTWDSANTSMAVFGLIGAAIHHFATRKKAVPYPFQTTPYAELEATLEQTFKIGKVKPDASVMRIPRTAIKGYSRGMMKGTQLVCDNESVTLVSAVGKNVLEEQGLRAVADV